MLVEYQADLRALTTELLLAEEGERKRMASALHDSVGQMLAVLKLQLSVAAHDIVPELAPKALGNSLALVDSVITQIRSLTTDLSPPILYELGLCPALEWLGEKFQKDYGVMFRFDRRAPATDLAGPLTVMLFQSARELLNNVGKHAQARNVTMAIFSQNDNLFLSIEDDGKGFEPPPPGKKLTQGQSFGLFSIRERMFHLGGGMVIESEPGHGTKVVLSVPSCSKGAKIHRGLE